MEDGATEAGGEEYPAGVGGSASTGEEAGENERIGGRQSRSEEEHGDAAGGYGGREFEKQRRQESECDGNAEDTHGRGAQQEQRREAAGRKKSRPVEGG